MNFRLPLLLFSICILSTDLVFADHEDIGVLKANFYPPTVGAPLESDGAGFLNHTYSGIRFTLLPEAPANFEFTAGQAAWKGSTEVLIVDTPSEQSFSTLGDSPGFGLRRNQEALGVDCCDGPWGLLVGEIYSDSFDPHLVQDSVRVEYRLAGSNEFVLGSVSTSHIIPEPSSESLLLLFFPIVAILRKRQRASSI